MFACRTTLEALQFALKLQHEFLQFLYLEATLLNLNLEIDIVFEGGIDLVRGELRMTFFEKVYAELDVKVFLLRESMCC